MSSDASGPGARLISGTIPANCGESGMTTLQSLQAIFKANFGLAPEVLQPDANLEGLEIDSLSMIEVLFAVEDEFGITVPPEPATWRSQMVTVGDLVSYVDKLIAEQRPPMAAGAAAS
ncbi:MAG: acyl carrier protein [Betaproteobacteria bacterium]